MDKECNKGHSIDECTLSVAKVTVLTNVHGELQRSQHGRMHIECNKGHNMDECTLSVTKVTIWTNAQGV